MWPVEGCGISHLQSTEVFYNFYKDAYVLILRLMFINLVTFVIGLSTSTLVGTNSSVLFPIPNSPLRLRPHEYTLVKEEVNYEFQIIYYLYY